jgi:hypothetical protein
MGTNRTGVGHAPRYTGMRRQRKRTALSVLGVSVARRSACTSRKLALASNACNQGFNAWFKGERLGSDAMRDSAIARVGTILTNGWAKAQQHGGSDCAASAASSDTAFSDMTSGVSSIVAGINTGLDLSNSDDLTCSTKLIKAAGALCAKLLKVAATAAKGAPQSKLDAQEAAAMNTFTRSWTRAACGTATSDDVAATVSALADSVVADALTPAP